MSDWTASNGVIVGTETQWPTGRRRFTFLGETVSESIEMSAEAGKALVERLDHERDEQLGRWRHPQWPTYVGRSLPGEGNSVLVFDEEEFAFRSFNRRNVAHGWGHAFAKAFFAAHPGPTPWHDAKIGELWEVTTANQENVRCFVVHDEPFSFVTADTTHHKPDSIIAATRIYPPVDPS